MQLILVRHGLPHRVKAVEGSSADPGLTSRGLAQAEQLNLALHHEPLIATLSSPARRARETASPIAIARRMVVQVVDDLTEYSEVGRGYTPVEEEVASGTAAGQRIAAGQFPDHVDVPAFRSRVYSALEAIAHRYEGRQSVLVVCHGGVINSYLTQVLGLPDGLPFPLDYVSVTRVIASRDGRRIVRSINETLHLA